MSRIVKSAVEAAAIAQPARPDPVAGGAVEFHAFRGGPRQVGVKLYSLPRSVVEGVFYTLLLEGDAGAEIRVFERRAPGDREGPVAVWQGARLGPLPGLIHRLLSASAPDAIRAAILDYDDYTDFGVVPLPPTARGAFGHPMRRYARDTAVYAAVIAIDHLVPDLKT